MTTSYRILVIPLSYFDWQKLKYVYQEAKHISIYNTYHPDLVTIQHFSNGLGAYTNMDQLQYT